VLREVLCVGDRFGFEQAFDACLKLLVVEFATCVSVTQFRE
jgi:hypothetical protein